MKINFSNLILIGLVLFLLMSGGFLGKISCDKAKLENINAQLNKQLMQKDLELGRAHTKFSNAEDKINQLNKDVQKEISERNATVKMYGELVAKYEVSQKELKAQDVKVTTEEKISFQKCSDNNGLMCFPFDETYVGHLYTFDYNFDLVPVKEFTGRYEDKRISIVSKVLNVPDGRGGWGQMNLLGYDLNMDFKVQFTETLTPTGAVNHYAELWEVDTEGRKIKKMELKHFEVLVENPVDRKWFWWNPKLDVGALVMVDLSPDIQLGGTIGISFMGWGKTKNDLTLRVGRVSLYITDLPGIGISPVLYNLGEPLPLLSNFWIGPHVSYSFLSQWQFGVILGAVL